MLIRMFFFRGGQLFVVLLKNDIIVFFLLISQNEIYQIIKYNPYVTRAEIAKKLGKMLKQ